MQSAAALMREAALTQGLGRPRSTQRPESSTQRAEAGGVGAACGRVDAARRGRGTEAACRGIDRADAAYGGINTARRGRGADPVHRVGGADVARGSFDQHAGAGALTQRAGVDPKRRGAGALT